ncbi:MAG: hemerythrin domain-containing protein [Nanoarchaeota archaeon]|nr:hemerythrin domain-containing protein [Nanoarchaeota archaeon]
MDPLGILKLEHKSIQKLLSELDEMTYSLSVNVRDLSFSFKEILRLLEEHEEKEALMFEALAEGSVEMPLEKFNFEHGDLKEKIDLVLKALDDGDEEVIKNVLHSTCGELVDRIKAHVFAEESVFNTIDWERVDKSVLEKIELLQIIPSRKLL